MDIVKFDGSHIRDAVYDFRKVCPLYLENQPDSMDSSTVVSAHEFTGAEGKMYWDVMGCYR